VEGVAKVGETLTAKVTPEKATVTYKWMRADAEDGEYVAIAGATDKTYTLSEADAGKWIKVEVKGTGNYTGTKSKVVGPVEEVEEPIETIEAIIDYNAVWNESRGTWYIKVTVPDENLDAGSVKSIHAITEAGVDLDEPRELTPDTDTVMWFGVAKADGEVTLKADGEYAYKVVRLDDSEYIFNFTYASSEVQGVEEVEEPIETIEAIIDYNAVWNESRGTWYIKVTVPDENLDAGSVKSIHAITEAGVDLDEPRELTPDTDTVMWFGVAKADGEVTLKADGEYAYKVVRLDDSEYIFNFTYASSEVQGVEEVEEPIETIEAIIDYNAVWNESRGTWYIKVTVPGEDLDNGSVESIKAIKEAGAELSEPRELTPDTDKVMWFGVAKADGELTLKEAGEYAYEVVRKDGTKYIFSFTYTPGNVQGVGEVDTKAPELVEVSPDAGDIHLAYDETFKLEVTASDKNLYELEVDHSFDGTLPEFSVYARADDPYGGQGEAFAAKGVTVTYDADEQKWTIDFGENVTNQIVDNGGITFYLVIKDQAGNQWGSMDPTTPENTFKYNVTQDVVPDEAQFVWDVNRIEGEGNMSEKLSELGNTAYEALEAVQKVEVAKLFILNRPDEGFADIAAIEIALGEAIDQYNSLLDAVNDSGTVEAMRTALEAIGTLFGINVTDLMAQAALDAKGDGYENVSEIIAVIQDSIANVGTLEEFKAALADASKSLINLTADFTTTEKILVSRDDVTINGNNKTITFTGDETGWKGNYVLHVYNTTGVTIKDIKLTGGDAALLVNGSEVTLTGAIDVSGNEFGGIESSKGVGVEKDPKLTVTGATFTNTSEAYGLPTIWEDQVEGTVVVADEQFILEKKIAKRKTLTILVQAPMMIVLFATFGLPIIGDMTSIGII
jgi:adenosine/AMP kinase